MPNLGSHKTSSVYFLLLFTALGVGAACTSGKIIPQTPYDSARTGTTFRVNINNAGAGELEKLPHVGPALAAKIIEYRKRYGPFRKAEHLLLIDGFSDKRYREIRSFITTE